MENIIYNELRSRGYNVDVGLVSLVARMRMASLSENSWR